MNIILLTNGQARRWQFDLSRAPVIAAAVGATAAAALAVFAIGWGIGAATGTPPDAAFDDFRLAMATEKTDIRALEAGLDVGVDTLIADVGQLSAGVIALDTLGQRLAAMASIDASDFDFGSVPAQGGPEHPDPAAVPLRFDDFKAEVAVLNGQLQDRRQQLEVLESVLLSRNLEGQVRPQGYPVKDGWISSYYGRRTDPITGNEALHMGIDFAGRHGMTITSVAAGVVNFSGTRQGFGKIVEINHGNGFVTRYAHNSENLVAVGQKVDKGQQIALMGATGRATGPNLHFEVLQNGRPVDPIKFVRTATGG